MQPVRVAANTDSTWQVVILLYKGQNGLLLWRHSCPALASAVAELTAAGVVRHRQLEFEQLVRTKPSC
jgi:hypothetical protein